jgi:hypothetical protein
MRRWVDVMGEKLCGPARQAPAPLGRWGGLISWPEICVAARTRTPAAKQRDDAEAMGKS